MTTTKQADINTNTTTANEVAGHVAAVGATGSGNGNAIVVGTDVDNGMGSPLTPLNRNSNGHTNHTNNFYSNSSNSNSNIGNNGSTTTTTTTAANNNQRVMNESNKRKKLKSRTATVPSGGGQGHAHADGYMKDHLDAWLETCLKDASNAQLSSSSEFLDYNPMPAGTGSGGGGGSGGINTTNPQKFLQQQMQQRHQQSQQQQREQQQQQQQNQAYLSNNSLNNANQQPPFSYIQQQQHQQQHSPQMQQQQFGLRSGPMSFSGGYTGGGSGPFSQGFQRNVPNYMKQSHYNNRYSMMFPHSGMGPGPGGYYQQTDAQDFASLPPIVNMMGGSSEMENNSTDVLDGSGSNPNISRGFRFSDPCLLNPSDNDSKVSGQNTPDRRNQLPSDLENNKFFAALMEQINLLHETNTKICRNLHETKGAYTPGMMTDVVREVKEAARVREDALLNRVKAMVEERQWSFNESNLRMMRDIEELKSQVHHLRADRKESNKRITHLEAENKYMRQMLTNLFNQRNAPDIIYENETLRTQRKSFPTAPARRSQSMNLHYGTIHHQPPTVALTVDEQDERLHIVESATQQRATAADMVTVSDRRTTELRSSFSSSDGGGSVGAGSCSGGVVGTGAAARNSGSSGASGVGICTVTAMPNGNAAMASGQQLMSPPNFALISTPAEEEAVKLRKKKGRKVPQIDGVKRNGECHDEVSGAAVAAAHADEDAGNEADDDSKLSSQELRQELQDAVAARKEADNRVIALEHMVKTLRLNSNTANNATNNNNASHYPNASVAYKLTNGTGGAGNGMVVNPYVAGYTYNINPCTTNNSSNALPPPTTHSSATSAVAAVIMPHHMQHKAHTIATASSSIDCVGQSPTKLSVAGPITDL
ncbi:signal transducer and activator of transcription B isoform X2 [Bactrocera dorsalis]|uniref:Signal transducer and activator of transcription B isoform X2 n=1 Tax=Bactrocera dorsalis TaxID=27457 RepID=A0A6I9VMZ2_BACDO|nr:signal transducer and activator of transcription B isoform X2 [Bactrocera dorsalis]